MKKILAIVMSLAMVLSMGVIFASADLGGYANGDASAFEPVGTINIDWDPNASSKIDLSDGKLDEWQAAQYNTTSIGPDNMISWKNEVHVSSEVKPNGSVVHKYDNTIANKANNEAQGEGEVDSEMPEGWGLTTFFVADKDYLYIGFYIVDDEVVDSNREDQHYNWGDAFQMNVDFGGKLGDIIENDPDRVESMGGNTKNIFYSFGYAGDGKPIKVYRQESGDDRALNELDGVKGTTAKTTEGWSAELQIAWQTLYDDYEYKAWAEDDAPIYVGGAEELPLKIGMTLYYLNHTNANDDPAKPVWAAGTSNGKTDENGIPLVTFDALDNGVSLELAPQEGLEFTCEKIVVLPDDDSEPESTEANESESTEPESTEPESTEPESTEAEPESTEPETTEAEDKDDETTKKPSDDEDDDKDDDKKDDDKDEEESGGCGGVIGIGAVAVLAAAAAAVALKKKD